MRPSAQVDQPSYVYLNGEFLPKEQAAVSVFDRSFMYGDGVFETLRTYQGRLFAFSEHFTRFAAGARALKLRLSISEAALANAALELVRRNRLPDGAIRFQLSRGIGARGYSPRGADSPLLVMTAHPLAAPKREVRLITSSYPLPPLSNLKTCNRMIHVLAKAEAEERDADDALFLNSAGFVAECTTSNIFWLEGDTLCTPALSTGCLPGVTRQIAMDVWGKSPRAELEAATMERLLASDGAFVTSSTVEIAEALSIDGRALPRSCAITDLQEAYSLQAQGG